MKAEELQAIIKASSLQRNLSANLIKSKLPSQLDLIVNEEIENYLNTLSFEDDGSLASQLSSPKMQRIKYKNELLQAAENSEMSNQVMKAFDLLNQEGTLLLTENVYKTVMTDFQNAGNILSNLNEQQPEEKSLQEQLYLSDVTMNALEEIAIATFQQERYSESLAVSILLLQLAPQLANSWYRAGMAAQQTLQFDLAYSAYETAFALDNTLLGAKVFPVQCYLLEGHLDKAMEAFQEAKNCLPDKEESEWSETLANIQQWIKRAA